jgi:hypothetical protein
VIGTWIAIGALFLSFLAFVASQLTTHRSASAAYVKGLEARIEALEDDLTTANKRVVELEGENLRLMRRLMANGGSS